VSAFKEQIREDFKNVLLDTDVYGRICSWNGVPLKIAEDAGVDSQDYKAQGVNSEQKIIYCRDIDLKPAPVVTEQVTFDNEVWYVTNVEKPFGYLKITLDRSVM
jgi:ssDNA-binding replication factor A large subunit